MKKVNNHDALRALIAKAAGEDLKEDCKKEVEEEVLDVERFLRGCQNFPPAPHSQYLYRHRGEQCLDRGDETMAANNFLLSQALTLKHQFLIQMSKRLSRTVTEISRGKIPKDEEVLQSLEATERQRQSMVFKEDDSVEDIVKTLPTAWTVVQISCYKSPKFTRFKPTKKNSAVVDGNPNLCLIRLSNDGHGPIIRKVISQDSSNVVPYLLELESIIKEMILVLKEPCKNQKKYWNLRDQLNQRMQTLVKSVEDSWLGAGKSYLLGKLKSEQALSSLQHVSTEVLQLLPGPSSSLQRLRLDLLLSAVAFISPEQVFAELCSIFPDTEEDRVYSATTLIQDWYSKSKLSLKDEQREPVILILDPEIQCLPWESLPCVAQSRQPVSRIPSLQYLSSLWQVHQYSTSSIVQSGLATDSVYYIINPDSSLPKTQERLESVIKGFREWEGLSGQPPQPGHLAKMLGNKDAFIYSGHGCGSKYLSSDEIEKLRIRVVPLLLGCSSGELSRYGRNLDPLGMAQSYLIGTAPAVVGFLWPVTDLDVDKWTIQFLEYWLAGQQGNMLQAIADQRMAFSHFVNSAALVVYGLPVSVKPKT